MSRHYIWITIQTGLDEQVRRDRFRLWADTWTAAEDTQSGFERGLDPAELRDRVDACIGRLMDLLERRHPRTRRRSS